jgi:hypothetical protein
MSFAISIAVSGLASYAAGRAWAARSGGVQLLPPGRSVQERHWRS